MFTGIIDHCGEVIEVTETNNNHFFWINTNFNDLELGESIAVDGMCLTITEMRQTQFRCDVSPHTLEVTAARHYSQGKKVNLERALRLSDRLGGHIVMGHVDTIVSLKEKKIHDNFIELIFAGLKPDELAYILPKGSVAINGVSLTVCEETIDGLKAMIVPHTLEVTNLKGLSEGDIVNLELDWLAKIFVKQRQSSLKSV